jgi:exonuclease SbcC
MIHELTLKNFQSHSATSLTFVAGVNVIIGQSDAGKSTLVRALRWVVHNRPAGDEFISHDAKETFVRLTLDDCVVERHKGGKNTYNINGTELVGFGQDVPTEVSQLLRLDDVNIQSQLEGPFLLSESPGVIARTFNKVVNLDKIDSALSNIRRLETETKNALHTCQSQIGELSEELTTLPDFVLIDGILSDVTQEYFETKRLEKRISHLKNLKKEIAFCLETMDNIPEVDFSILEAKIGQRDSQKKILNSLLSLNRLLKKQINSIEYSKREVAQCQQKLKSLCPDLCPLCAQPITHTLFCDVQSVEDGVQKVRNGLNTVRTRVQTKLDGNVTVQNPVIGLKIKKI